MRCRYVNKIYMNEGNGFTVALYSTQDTSVPLSARDKYLASRKMIGFRYPCTFPDSKRKE